MTADNAGDLFICLAITDDSRWYSVHISIPLIFILAYLYYVLYVFSWIPFPLSVVYLNLDNTHFKFDFFFNLQNESMAGMSCFSACSQHEIPKHKCFQHRSGRRGNATSLEVERHHPAAKCIQALVESPEKNTLSNTWWESTSTTSSFPLLIYYYRIRTPIHQVTKKAEVLNFKLYMAFIDNKIFDSTEQESVLQALRNKGTQDKYFRIMRIMYSHSHEKINIGPEWEKFTLEIGVKLSNQISPELFIVYCNIYWKDATGTAYTSLISTAKTDQ